MKRPHRLRSQKVPDDTFAQIWKMVDGAVRDALAHHPEYLAVPEARARRSIVKRVTGQVHGFAVKTAEGARPARPAA